MSKIADRMIDVDKLINCNIVDDCRCFCFSYNGTDYKYALPAGINFILYDEGLKFVYDKKNKGVSKYAGLHNALLSNMINGLLNGFVKRMKVVGVGYRVAIKNGFLILQVGFSHSVRFLIPDGISINIIDDKNIKKGHLFFDVKGSNKERLGLFVSQIRSVAPVEPYKQKGISVDGDLVLQKTGKSKK